MQEGDAVLTFKVDKQVVKATLNCTDITTYAHNRTMTIVGLALVRSGKACCLEQLQRT